MQVLIDIPEKYFDELITREGLSIYEMAIIEGFIISPHITNGDIIKAMFPNAEYKKDKLGNIWVVSNAQLGSITLTQEWWNAPYKKG